MKESISEEDSEGDLSDKKRFVLSILVLSAVLVVGFQQWQGAFRWESPVARASGNADVETVCALKENFSKFLLDEGMQISFAKDDACVVKPAVTEESDVNATEAQLERELLALVSAYPMVSMVPSIVRQSRTVAAFLVGIAKKESDWGKHSPRKNGEDCFNYWGYKGLGDNGSAEGYACFASPEEAVQTVGNRLLTLAQTQHRDTPEKMLVWKCGSTCKEHSPEGVRSWVSVVDIYFQKLQ